MIGARQQRRFRQSIFYFVLLFSSVIMLIPVIWIWISSLKSNKEIRASALGLPSQLQFQNYVDAWVGAHFDRYFLNSALVALSAVIIVLIVGSLAAFAFARMDFRGNQALFFLIFVGLTFPVSARLGPLLTLMYKLNLVDTRWSLIFTYSAGSLPFAILMMRSFFRQFPKELEDAARIDGASSLQFFVRVLLPLSTPALFTLGIFTFMGAWNEFLVALLLINKEALRTLPLGLMTFQGEYNTDYALSIAGINITAMPVIIIYILLQRNFIKGLTAGSLK